MIYISTKMEKKHSHRHKHCTHAGRNNMDQKIFTPPKTHNFVTVPHFSHSAFYPSFRSIFPHATFHILHVLDFPHSAFYRYPITNARWRIASRGKKKCKHSQISNTMNDIDDKDVDARRWLSTTTRNTRKQTIEHTEATTARECPCDSPLISVIGLL